ncbi:hypothetical protein KHX94_08100 [Shewanella dokdonensis]|uniref:Uncharacterized protein n=1 Tax=Shewanella dokdonensis TaxID=712036 RepID=A0ABX8DKB8_9GAMM|nr:hypothetical protein [Shewanella dokdonensis]QVK24426.1 hypothetical protein KHX94_08100 [Shewanella dokdonensis]
MSTAVCRQSGRHRLAILAVDDVVLFDLAIPQQMFPMAKDRDGAPCMRYFSAAPRQWPTVGR